MTAVDNVEVLMLGQREFSGLLDVVPTLAQKLLVGLARRIDETEADRVN